MLVEVLTFRDLRQFLLRIVVFRDIRHGTGNVHRRECWLRVAHAFHDQCQDDRWSTKSMTLFVLCVDVSSAFKRRLPNTTQSSLLYLFHAPEEDMLLSSLHEHTML